jgi:hypothetical protein
MRPCARTVCASMPPVTMEPLNVGTVPLVYTILNSPSNRTFINRFVDQSHPFEVQAPLADNILAWKRIAGCSRPTQKRALCAEIGDYGLRGGLWYRFGDGEAYHDKNAEEGGREGYHGDEVKQLTAKFGRYEIVRLCWMIWYRRRRSPGFLYTSCRHNVFY